jgi:uncharacterized membrane protein YkoI
MTGARQAAAFPLIRSLNPPIQMKLPSFVSRSFAVLAFASALFTGVAARAADNDEAILVARLKQSKHSLAEGISQAEKQNGVGITAKFEMEGDTLMLSVYTAKAGRSADAEHNVLLELNGDAAKATWEPATEVFEDKKHLTRSAMHLTLVQLSKLSLGDAIKAAQATQPGTVYSIIPAVKDGNAVYEVKVAAADGKTVTLAIDVRTGKATK